MSEHPILKRRTPKRWILSRTNPEYVSYLSGAAGILPVTAQILINRNIKTPDEVRDFLLPGIGSLGDPYKLDGMDKAVRRIKLAVKRDELILIHGDYDADGATATAVMVETIEKLSGLVSYFIPNRFEHGYGFHVHAVEKAKADGVTLIITVDCGITSFETVLAANAMGIDVIITDHHEPHREAHGESQGSSQSESQGNALNKSGGEAGKKSNGEALKSNGEVGGTSRSGTVVLPQAFAILNPKAEERATPLSILSGAGVALKLAYALLNSAQETASLLDIAAIGTVADIVPLTGENRTLVREGLKALNYGARPGVRALVKIGGTGIKNIDTCVLAYNLIPRLNSAGRMDNADCVVKLLTTESFQEAEAIAGHLEKLNRRRQRTEEEVFEAALADVNKKGSIGRVVVASGEGLHEGVLGIVASKLTERFNLPAFVFNIKDGIAKGSARGVFGMDVCEGISRFASRLHRYGGHKQAAGLALDAKDLPAFEESFNEYMSEACDGADFTPALRIDAEVSLRDINRTLMDELARLAPYGSGNPEPLIGARGLFPINPTVVGTNHLKLRLGSDGYALDAIGFAQGETLSDLSPSIRVDAVFTPTFNEWNGNKTLQLNVKAIRPSGG